MQASLKTRRTDLRLIFSDILIRPLPAIDERLPSIIHTFSLPEQGVY